MSSRAGESRSLLTAGSDADVLSGALSYPYALASNDPAFRGIAGGVLWLVSSPQYGKYRLPPSLVARLQIKDVVAEDDSVAEEIDSHVREAGRWVALADRDRSVYLPLNNAFDVLCNLRFLGRHSGPIRLTPAAADSRPPAVCTAGCPATSNATESSTLTAFPRWRSTHMPCSAADGSL